MDYDKQLIVALDFASDEDCLAFVGKLDPRQCRVKVGKELFTRFGPALVSRIQRQGFEVFLDLKFHDIPNTVAAACRAAADLGVWMCNVHASGGRAMMEASRKALSEKGSPLLIAVTVLTSLGAEDMKQLGIERGTEQQVRQLARLSAECGLDGVVCSALEVSALRSQHASDFKLVTPGIRPAGDSADDQKRIVSPAQALSDGSDYLVIGRPITRAADPAAKLLSIIQEIQSHC
jgi:orotidine-5'-phosphate decarboxylase